MGRSVSGSDSFNGEYELPPYTVPENEVPEHPAHVSDFYLDTFEVTVGFRKFFEQYPASLPVQGDGAHPLVSGSGWSADWNALMPVTKAELEEQMDRGADPTPYGYPTWTSTPADREAYPINCVSW
jgi:formylglycine-generating enzyme required for sulfatase activity